MKSYNRALEQAVLNAYYRGKVIVASSGNDGKRKTIDYPARFPQVVSVGATTRIGKIAPFSNRGKQIDIYAPGERVYSSWLHGKYNELSGTSMATAHVSGVIALMLAIEPCRRSRSKARCAAARFGINKRRKHALAARAIECPAGLCGLRRQDQRLRNAKQPQLQRLTAALTPLPVVGSGRMLHPLRGGHANDAKRVGNGRAQRAKQGEACLR